MHRFRYIALAAPALVAAALAVPHRAAAQAFSRPALALADPAERFPASIFSPGPRQNEAAGNPEVGSHLRRQVVSFTSSEAPGTIVIDTPNTYLYYVLGNGRAIRYGIGVGRDGFTWSGTQRIGRKSQWPDWTPPREMIARQPYLPRFMAGGPSNPLGARALYLGKTMYRIHGTNAPSTIGARVSSGCIRMLNEDVIDLYERVSVGTKVVVLPDRRYRAPNVADRTSARPPV